MQRKYLALIDTGSTFSIIDNRINNFERVNIKPVQYSTINGKGYFDTEIHTPAFDELKAPEGARIRWKAMNLTGRKYQFIIGNDILNKMNTIIDLEIGIIELNGQPIKFHNKRITYEEIHTLEYGDDNINRLKLDHLNSEEYKEIEKIITRYKSLFFKEGDKLTSTTKIMHEIPTNTDQQINSKLYRYPPKHEEEVRRQIKEMTEQGIIQKSNSKYSSPLIVVPKKMDNSGKRKYRIVVDYRKLNEFTTDDKFPLPNIDSILDKLGKAQYFTTIDLAKGYHQILIKKEDRHKTAFVTPHGLYEFIRMPFGLKNAPATFQRLMNQILRDYINKTCVVYLDDILIFSTSLKEHIKAIRDIFDILESINLKIQIDKCSFMKKETEFLGHVITEEEKPNPNKIDAIKNVTIPKTQHEIKSFLGLSGYYRKFVKDYAKVAQPMTKYLKKNCKVNINDPNYIEAFEKLKHLIISHPILRFPNFEKTFTLTTDASNYAIGAVLSQEGHPVCFASRTLNNHERNYSATDKEFLAIMWSVNYFRPYLYGNKFKILTDHQPIKYLHAKYRGKDMSPRHQRWLLKLGEYQFEIEYLKGKDNKVADFLSRTKFNEDVNSKEGEMSPNIENFSPMSTKNDTESDIIFNVEDNNTLATIHSAEEELLDHISIKEEIVNKYKTQIILTNNKTQEIEIINGKRIIYIADCDMTRLTDIFRRFIKKGTTGIYSELPDHQYNIVQEKLIELFSNDPQIKFVKSSYRAQDLKTEVEAVKQISLYHVRESLHSGIQETFNQIKYKIYYPKLLELIQIVISQCDICKAVKYDRNPIKPKFEFSETPTNINQIIHIDTYVFKKCNFLTVIDKFSKFGAAYYLTDRNHITIIEVLEEHFTKMGKPKKIVADNEFKAIQIKQLLEKEEITLHLTKPNSHTGNSDVERFHNTVAEKLRIILLNDGSVTTKQAMQQAVQNYNERFHSTVKATPQQIQSGKISLEKVYENLKSTKEKRLYKLNTKREDYEEVRTTGFIKNYKAVRHKHIPKYKKAKLDNIHTENIKRPLKLSADDWDTYNETDVFRSTFQTQIH